MTDTFAPSFSQPTSSFEATPEFSPDPAFDVSQVDRNIRTISSIEQRWRLPTLPEEVKLDLATMQGTTPESLTDLLFGLDSDFSDEEPVQAPELAQQPFEVPRTGMEQFQVVASGIAGQGTPTKLSDDAVKQFKAQAIRRGLLDPGTPLDSNWSPELNRVRTDMMYEDLDRMYAGDRPGAVSTNKAIEVIGKLTQPGALLAAATELDLFWDFGAIKGEWSSWDDKWRKVGESTDPWDFAKNLVDAVTGPIDDIVVPAVNLALLTTGVGAMANAGRFAYLGARAAESGSLFARALYSSSRLFVPSAVGTLTDASLTAQRLARSSGTIRRGLGGLMTAWRELPVVARSKQAVQLGMRAGLLSQAENVLPGYAGGVSLADVPAIGDAAQGLENFSINDPRSVIPELLFAPTNILNPGALVGDTGLLRTAGRGALRTLGSNTGRAALGAGVGAGVGALAGDDNRDIFAGAAAGAIAMGLLPVGARILSGSPDLVKFGTGGGVLGAAIGGTVALLSDDVDTSEGVLFGALAGVGTVAASSAISKLPNPGKWIGHPTDIAAKFDFRPVLEDQQGLMSFQRGFRTWLEQTDGEDVARFDRILSERNSFLEALGEYSGMVDELGKVDMPAVEAAYSYVYVAAMLDQAASMQSLGSMEAFHHVRNKLLGQLQTFDLESQFLPEQVARAMTIDKANGRVRSRTFKKILDEITADPSKAYAWAEAHNENAKKTLSNLLGNATLPDSWGQFGQMGSQDRLGFFEAYIPQVMDTFGNWKRFSKQTMTIEQWLDDGVLDGAQWLQVHTPWGSVRNPRKGDVLKITEEAAAIDDALTDTMLRNPQLAAKTAGRFSPLARLQPTGTFTVARRSTVTAQELEQITLGLEQQVKTAEKLKFLQERGVMQRLSEALTNEGLDIRTMSHKELKSFLRRNKLTSNQRQVEYVANLLRRHQIGPEEFDSWLDGRIQMLLDNQQVGMIENGVETMVDQPLTRYKLSTHVSDADGKPLAGLDALKAHVRDLKKKTRYTAAAIDHNSIVESVRLNQGDEAAEAVMRQLIDLEADGYRLVHGVEYMMPHKLATLDSLPFRDFGVREMNAASLGSFFSRKQPAVVRALAERRQKAALLRALEDLDNFKRSQGVAVQARELAPDSAEITDAYRDLHSILLEIQDPIAQMVSERKLMSWADRVTLAPKTAMAPLRVEDLTSRRKFVIDRLVSRGWEQDEAEAIFTAIRNFRATEFDQLGLYALEAKARSKNFAVSGLKWLDHSFAEGYTSPGRLGAAVGAFTGQELAARSVDENSSDDTKLGARVAGLLGGAVLGGAAPSLIRKGAGFVGEADKLTRAVRWAEQKPGFMLADHLARARDAFRFSLSPIFDLSRYSEGLVLGNTGVPLRHADGSRIVLPINLSPTATKKRLGEAAYQQARAEFGSMTKGLGHGDLDVLDSTAHWFEQIGILGFSPMDWQAAVYAELRNAGVAAEMAYEGARGTQTYGLKGRSAAELSANFVFFPFSFQKKMLTHMGEFLTDDIGRSILLHDMFKTYEVLDQEYDLDTFWKEHIPGFQMLQRMNVMAYGISPGRFGGINSQLFETTGRALGASVNTFMPIGVNIQGEEDWLELEKLGKSLMPVWNDINWMVHDVKDSKGLFTTGMLDRGQIRRGYDEWNEYRTQLNSWLEDQGFTWSDLHRQPWLIDQKLAYEAKRLELQNRYPAWRESRQETLFNIQALAMEKNDLLDEAAVDPTSASPKAQLLSLFEREMQRVKTDLGYVGVSVDGTDGWLDAPPWAVEELRSMAVRLAESDPRFIGVYRKFYEKELGPIEVKL